MRILLLSSAYNSLTQNAHVELQSLGHDVAVATAVSDGAMRGAISQFQPELILSPMLTRVIPRDIWGSYPCMILHPGVIGDRGPMSLDWAILNEENQWGVSVVQAVENVDSGPIWATCNFKMRDASKSTLYRDEVAHAAMRAMLVAVRRFESGLFVPTPLDYSQPAVRGRYRPAVRAEQRQIDWYSDRVATILRKIRSADGSPGVLDKIDGEPFYLYGAHEEGILVGQPGEIIAQRHGAICRAAVDGAVWISHLKRKGCAEDGYFKLPAVTALGDRGAGIPEIPLPFHYSNDTKTFRDIWYEESNDVGYICFRFYNGAMGTDHCRRLAEAVMYARNRPTKVIALLGGRDFWSNGIHLNLIEAAEDPAEESWRNINAMNDLVHAILTATDKITIAAMYGSAGAGGVMMALAADHILAREGIVLNTLYRRMGGLYGSEYWTYSLPKRVGAETASRLVEQCRPLSVNQAKTMGLIDDIIIQDDLGADAFTLFRSQIIRIAEKLAQNERCDSWLSKKKATREADEKAKPLEAYRFEELEEMKLNFWGEDPGYHVARSAFVRKQTPTADLHSLPPPAVLCGHETCEVATGAGGSPSASAIGGRSSMRRSNQGGWRTASATIDALQQSTFPDEPPSFSPSGRLSTTWRS